MLTIDDLKVMKPSDALEKAVEMLPLIRCDWNASDQRFQKETACPGCLLAIATGAGLSYRDLDFPPSRKVLDAVISLGRPYTYAVDNYGEAISMLTNTSRLTWPRAIALLREKGL